MQIWYFGDNTQDTGSIVELFHQVSEHLGSAFGFCRLVEYKLEIRLHGKTAGGELGVE